MGRNTTFDCTSQSHVTLLLTLSPLHVGVCVYVCRVGLIGMVLMSIMTASLSNLLVWTKGELVFPGSCLLRSNAGIHSLHMFGAVLGCGH